MTNTQEFFKQKKDWSKYKDFILAYYLKPYISKVRCLGKPIAIIDCFAGPGTFDDGNDGSPMIICKEIEGWRKNGENKVVGIFIEKKAKYYSILEKNIIPYKKYAIPIRGNFVDCIDSLSDLCSNHTVFLYLDPFGVKDLCFDEMEKIFQKVSKKNSVEFLINFNCRGFLRWALKILKCDAINEEDAEEGEEIPNIDDLNKVANGTYWQEIVAMQVPFDDKENRMMNEYLNQFKQFGYVCCYPVKEKYSGNAKYYLIYATRHKDGLLLMSDTMYKAREKFLNQEFMEGRLFDMRPPIEEKDEIELMATIKKAIAKDSFIKRKDIKIKSVLSGLFCRYSDSDFNKAIKKMLEKNEIDKTAGKIEECGFFIKKAKMK